MAMEPCSAWMLALTRAYWALALAASAASLANPWAAELSRHGKTRAAAAPARGGGGATVPKAWFAHFYLLAAAWSGALLACAALGLDPLFWFAELWLSGLGLCGARDSGSRGWRDADGLAVLSLSLFFLHALRRLLESLYVTRFSPSARMHVAGYLLGMTFYLAAPWTLIVETEWVAAGAGAPQPGLFRAALALMVLYAASLEQHRCHLTLAELRTTGLQRGLGVGAFFFSREFERTGAAAAAQGPAGAPPLAERYAIPGGGLFELCSSPHYFCEVWIYVAWLLLQPSSGAVLAMLAFVLVTMLSSAQASHRFYLERFPDSYPRGRAVLLPLLY
jgi:3-oxo-5-alpha-steroid 4-dehydrogenase 3